MKEAVTHTEILRQFDELQAELREWWKTSTEAEKVTVRANIDSYMRYAEQAGEKGLYALLAGKFSLLGMFACYAWYDTKSDEIT